MQEKTTSDLEIELLGVSAKNIDCYFLSNCNEFIDPRRSFYKYMAETIKQKKLLKQDILLKADIPQNYGYKLLTEEKITRQRDIILRICYAAEFSLLETQHAIKLYHMNPLYARETRDALIMICINTRPGGINEVNELLKSNGMKPLQSCGAQY